MGSSKHISASTRSKSSRESFPAAHSNWCSTGRNYTPMNCARIGIGDSVTRRSSPFGLWSNMHRVAHVKSAPGYILEITFSDGLAGGIDLSDPLFCAMVEPLRDQTLFNQVQVDEYGAINWPNGADLAPDALYRIIASGGRAGTRTPDPLGVNEVL